MTTIDLEIKIAAYQADVLEAGNFDDEDAYNLNTDAYDKRKVRVVCPHCNRTGSPLCSSKTKMFDSGWRWVGDSHKEPYSSHLTHCRCNKKYRFTVYTGQ